MCSNRVKLSNDQEHGRAFGRLVWRGRPTRDKDQEIHPKLKRQWKLLGTPNYHTFTGKPEQLLEHIPKNTERTC